MHAFRGSTSEAIEPVLTLRCFATLSMTASWVGVTVSSGAGHEYWQRRIERAGAYVEMLRCAQHDNFASRFRMTLSRDMCHPL